MHHQPRLPSPPANHQYLISYGLNNMDHDESQPVAPIQLGSTNIKDFGMLFFLQHMHLRNEYQLIKSQYHHITPNIYTFT